MYRITYFSIIFILCTEMGLSQQRLEGKQHILAVDALISLQTEFSLQYEKRIKSDMSILLSLSLKKHNLPVFFSQSKYSNFYNKQITEYHKWTLFTSSYNTEEQYLDGTQPLPIPGKFVPKLSVPLKLNWRKYWGKSTRNIRSFIALGLAASYHKGYTVEGNTESDTLYRSSSEMRHFNGRSTSITTIYFHEKGTNKPTNTITLGLNTACGLQFLMKNNWIFELKAEVGGYFLNAEPDGKYYGVRPFYKNLHCALGYSF